MKLRIEALLSVCLLLAGGCAKSQVIAKSEPAVATVKAEQPKEAPARIVATGTVINTVAAVVNDDIITLFEVNREAQPVIRENEKKGALDDAAHSKIRRLALDSLVEKKLVEQKIKELNIKVSEEEI